LDANVGRYAFITTLIVILFFVIQEALERGRREGRAIQEPRKAMSPDVYLSPNGALHTLHQHVGQSSHQPHLAGQMQWFLFRLSCGFHEVTLPNVQGFPTTSHEANKQEHLSMHVCF
jgi:hypothetical protein